MKMDEKKWRSIITESDQKLKNIKARMDTFKNNLLLNKIVFMKGSVKKFTKFNAASLLAGANLVTSNSTDSRLLSFPTTAGTAQPTTITGSQDHRITFGSITTTHPATTGVGIFSGIRFGSPTSATSGLGSLGGPNVVRTDPSFTQLPLNSSPFASFGVRFYFYILFVSLISLFLLNIYI